MQNILEELNCKNKTGCAEYQITHLTNEIKKLSEHLKINKKDNHSKYGLQKKIERRKKLLKYLKRSNLERYILTINLNKLKDIN